MNKDDFRQEVDRLSAGTRVDVKKVPLWFTGTLAALDALGKQKEMVEHPGHRGSSRETPLMELLEQILPGSISVMKGFAINSLMATSKEQDLLVVDRNIAGKVLPQESYFPIEACLASIQVKSTLTRSTIRDAVLNCITVKKLFGWPLVEEQESDAGYDKLCFGIFGYACDWELEELAEVITDEMAVVKRHLWPNEIYVLGKGMVIPGDERGVSMDHKTMFTGSDFRSVGHIGAEPALPKSEAYAFLWFIANIIDHCMQQRKERAIPSYMNYWFHTLITQIEVSRQIEDKK